MLIESSRSPLISGEIAFIRLILLNNNWGHNNWGQSGLTRILGLNDNLLRRWVKEHADPVKRSFPGHGNPRDEEVTRLKRELLQVKKERDFLKEAAAYFAKGSK